MLPIASSTPPSTDTYAAGASDTVRQSAQTLHPGQHLCLLGGVPIPKDEWEAVDRVCIQSSIGSTPSQQQQGSRGLGGVSYTIWGGFLYDTYPNVS